MQACPERSQVKSTRHRIFCIYGFSFLIFAAASAFAQDSASGMDSNQGSNYRFLEALPGQRPGAVGVPGASSEEDDEAARVEVFPKETEEERKTRDSIRNVLRLLDGDTVEVTRDVHIRMVGVHLPPEMSPQERAHFERFTEDSKGWLQKFLEDPEKAIEQYDGMNSKINYHDKEGGGFTYYYLYVPDMLLDDMRKQQLSRYDDWVKNKKGGLPTQETVKDKADLAKADLKLRPVENEEAHKDVKEYVISEAKYYYDDGTLKREEVFRDGKIMLKRVFSPKGELLDEVFFDARASDLVKTKKAAS
ncbi:MAG TPA: hypothetical protein VL688_05090 [Verrucomicrobiae bacterium]|nr:hypothetical protein [Verrucomicrobiae bacterium]